MTRFSVLLGLALLLAGCASTPPPSYPPLSYDYLLPLRLNVAAIAVRNNAQQQGASDVANLAPVTPVAALSRMAHDRLFAAGVAGQAVFSIDTASILHVDDGLYGQLGVHLDILTADGQRTAFAEARVAWTRRGGKVNDDLDAALYQLTKEMMERMNVEFEYQVRHSLTDWVQTAPGTVAPVESQTLPPPS